MFFNVAVVFIVLMVYMSTTKMKIKIVLTVYFCKVDDVFFLIKTQIILSPDTILKKENSALNLAGTLDTDKASCKVNWKQYFSQCHATAVKNIITNPFMSNF